LARCGDAEQIVGRERRERVSHHDWSRRYLNEFAPPRQLNRYPAHTMIRNVLLHALEAKFPNRGMRTVNHPIRLPFFQQRIPTLVM
jgi:hypothetical protein